jgi:hypothetical protein
MINNATKHKNRNEQRGRGKNQLYVEKNVTSFAKMMLWSINRHHAHDTSTELLFRRVPRGADARMKK